jgi:PAS domain S-box-containing protein
MNTRNNQVLPQSPNGNNGGFDYEAMIRGLISLCDKTELLICLDRNAVIRHIKETARNELLGNSAKLIGKCIWDFLPAEAVAGRKKVFEQVVQTGRPIRYEDARNGFWFDSMVYPICDRQGTVKQVLVMGRDITRSKQMEREMKRLNECLEELVTRRTAELEDKAKNLQKRDDEKKELEQSMVLAIKQFILPYVRQIQQNGKDPQILTCIDAIDTNLKQFNSGFNHSIRSKAYGLTPSEIEVALYIKAGKSSKDIAGILKICPETVESHRKNIRHKMGLKGKKENLQAYLAALGT